MPVSLENIKTSLARSAPQGQEACWNALVGDFVSMTSSPPTPEVERLLLAILRFDGELQLDEASEMPHRMSPENMLKSLAVQALGRWTGATYLPTMRRLQATASPALSCVIRGVIQMVSAEKGKANLVEAVADFRTEEPVKLLKLDLNGDLQSEAEELEHGDGLRKEDLPVHSLHGMTYMAVTPARTNQVA